MDAFVLGRRREGLDLCSQVGGFLHEQRSKLRVGRGLSEFEQRSCLTRKVVSTEHESSPLALNAVGMMREPQFRSVRSDSNELLVLADLSLGSSSGVVRWRPIN